MRLPCITAETVQTLPVHACVGYDIVREGFLSFQKPSYVIPDDQITESFTSISLLQSKIDSLTDHNGAVYRLTGSYLLSTDIRVSGKQNLTLYSPPTGRALLDCNNTSNFGVLIGNSTNCRVLNMEVRDAAIHGIMVGRENMESGGQNNDVLNNLITGAGNTAITLRNGAKNCLVECNEWSGIGPSRVASKGEGIYLGYGPAGGNSQYVEDIVVRGNYGHDSFNEGLDVKRDCRRITAEYNRFEDLELHSQGAMTFALDDRGQPGYAFNSVARYNCILRTTTRSSDGNGIVVANAPMDVHDNIIGFCASDAIDVYADCDGPSADVRIYNNILHAYNGLPVRENVGDSGGGSTPCAISRSKNLVQSDAVNDECIVSSEAFRGPLTTCEGFQAA